MLKVYFSILLHCTIVFYHLHTNYTVLEGVTAGCKESAKDSINTVKTFSIHLWHYSQWLKITQKVSFYLANGERSQQHTYLNFGQTGKLFFQWDILVDFQTLWASVKTLGALPLILLSLVLFYIYMIGLLTSTNTVQKCDLASGNFKVTSSKVPVFLS